jgi:hypothetical protein
MKKKLKKIYEASKELPDITLFILTFFKILIQRSDVQYKKKNKETINILGNGPSGLKTYLKNKDVSEKLMCVNYFALTKEFSIFKPDYYTLIDPVYFLDLNEKNLELIRVLNNVSWDMKLLIPSKYKNVYSTMIMNKNIEINAIRFNYLPGKNKLVHFLYSKNLAVPKFQNVVIACIYVSINKGFSKINLHGVEASEFKNFIVNEKNEVLLETQHSYGNNTINLFEERIIKKGEFWKFLMHYPIMLKGFSQIESYSKYLDTKIYNYTKNSYIDSFEKI